MSERSVDVNQIIEQDEELKNLAAWKNEAERQLHRASIEKEELRKTVKHLRFQLAMLESIAVEGMNASMTHAQKHGVFLMLEQLAGKAKVYHSNLDYLQPSPIVDLDRFGDDDTIPF